MFKRRREPEQSLEIKILQTIPELEDSTGDAVAASELMNRLGPGLTTTLEKLTSQGLTERCKDKDGFWADRLTEAGREALEAAG